MHNGRVNNRVPVYQTKIRIGDELVKIIKSIDYKRLQSSFYEKLIYIYRYFNLIIEKKMFNFYTYIVGTIRLKKTRYD